MCPTERRTQEFVSQVKYATDFYGRKDCNQKYESLFHITQYMGTSEEQKKINPSSKGSNWTMSFSQRIKAPVQKWWHMI